MSDEKIPPIVARMLEGYGPEEMAQIVQWGKSRHDALAAGRKAGQIKAKQYADKRYEYIVDMAIACKEEYPYMTELGVIDNVIARLQDKVQRKERGFRVLKPSTIITHLKQAGFLDSEGLFKRD